jgi:putative phosphoribosyl transferase
VAVPISSPETYRDLAVEVDEIICVETPQPFCSVGLWYEDFPQTTDEEVRNLLKQAQTTFSAQRPVVSSQ